MAARAVFFLCRGVARAGKARRPGLDFWREVIYGWRMRFQGLPVPRDSPILCDMRVSFSFYAYFRCYIRKRFFFFVAAAFSDPLYAACMSRPVACCRCLLDGGDWLSCFATEHCHVGKKRVCHQISYLYAVHQASSLDRQVDAPLKVAAYSEHMKRPRTLLSIFLCPCS